MPLLGPVCPLLPHGQLASGTYSPFDLIVARAPAAHVSARPRATRKALHFDARRSMRRHYNSHGLSEQLLQSAVDPSPHGASDHVCDMLLIQLQVSPPLQPFHKNDLRHGGHRTPVIFGSPFERRLKGGGNSKP